MQELNQTTQAIEGHNVLGPVKEPTRTAKQALATLLPNGVGATSRKR